MLNVNYLQEWDFLFLFLFLYSFSCIYNDFSFILEIRKKSYFKLTKTHTHMHVDTHLKETDKC